MPARKTIINRQRPMMKALAVISTLVFPFTSFSAPEAAETVSKRGTINDDYYAAGGTVDIDADIAGDLVIAGGELLIGYRIQNDVIAAGGSVAIRGEVLDDVRVAGGEISIDAVIGDDLFVAGGEINITSRAVIGGEAWLAGGEVHIAGTIHKGLHVGAGDIRISGTVQGDVELQGQEIYIDEGAVIEGILHYKGPNEAKIHPDAKIMGKITYEQVQWDSPHKGYSLFFSVTLLVAGIVLFLLFPGFTLSSAKRIFLEPWKSLGIGFAFLILTPIAAILLMSVVLGVWVGLSLLAFYLVALIIGLLVSCFFVADWGAQRLNKDVSTTSRRIISLTIAIILIGVIQLIPLIGGLFTLALLLLGLGAGVSQLYLVYSQADSA
jgi:cytoskeletal protein CcmA (bactofilin family)